MHSHPQNRQNSKAPKKTSGDRRVVHFSRKGRATFWLHNRKVVHFHITGAGSHARTHAPRRPTRVRTRHARPTHTRAHAPGRPTRVHTRQADPHTHAHARSTHTRMHAHGTDTAGEATAFAGQKRQRVSLSVIRQSKLNSKDVCRSIAMEMWGSRGRERQIGAKKKVGGLTATYETVKQAYAWFAAALTFDRL